MLVAYLLAFLALSLVFTLLRVAAYRRRFPDRRARTGRVGLHRG